MNGCSIYLMIQLAQSMGVMSKEIEYDLAWMQGEDLYREYEESEYNKDTTGEYQCIHDFLSTKEKTAFQNCHKCKEEYLPTPDFGFCPNCLTHL
jgi:hypothetical protein